MNFHVDVQKMDPVTFKIDFLCYVSECVMIQIFLACRLFFFFFFSQISADFSIFCGGVLSNSMPKTVQGIFLFNSSLWVDILQTYLSRRSIKNADAS